MRVARAVYVYVGRVGGKFNHLGVPVFGEGPLPINSLPNFSVLFREFLNF